MIKTCPTCGAKAVREVTEDVKFSSGRRARNIPHLKCGACGERLFGRESCQMIEAQRRRGQHKKAS